MGWMNKDFTGFLVIYKLMRGRVKNVTVHKETDSILEPDPNYDCHTSKYTLSQVSDNFLLVLHKTFVLHGIVAHIILPV